MTTIQQVELGVLGPLQVRQFGLPVAIPGAKPRAVLTMLGLHAGSVVAADALVELLWGDEPPRTAAKALQTHISALRRALGDGFVVTRGTGWTLSTDEIDVTRYVSSAALGRAAMGSGNATEAVTRFDEALALWRGVPELPDGRRGKAEKTRWSEDHAALVEDRADALLATGRAAEIIGELEAAIGDAPLRERRWGHLMLALYRAGRQGEALAAFQRARSLLAEELGIDPGPDLRRLEAAIVGQDVSLELPAAQQHSVITRAVTFLLTDIEGSTAAWERDADAMAVALARHDEIVEQVVTFRGGRLIKTRGEGDATFSVFDRPSAAAAAAVELQEAMRHESWEPAEPVRIRIALHTGEVEYRDGDYFGRAVNRAARLRSLADGGQILCSGATAELVVDSLADDVVLDDLGTRQLKNLARPERVFELRLSGADDDSRPPTVDAPIERPALPAVLAGPGPFVGRAGELGRLLAGWRTTLDAGARAVLIAGEPGVGKTRLAGEWSRRAYEEGAVVLYGRCDEDLGAPYQPFAEALRSLVPGLGADRLRGLRGVEALLPLVPGLSDVLPEVTAPTRADPDTERYALFDAVVAVMGAVSDSAPVILVLDDLHWAAKPTLLLLRHLLRFGEHARVQIVGTYRSTDLDRSHPLAAMLADLNRDGSADRLQLSGLGDDDVTAYVAAAGYDDEDLARALASVTGGNPFFLIEALRHVEESGGRWDPSTLPQGVREAVTRRLSRLSSETNKALGAAAVVGSRFAVELVEQVVEQDLVDAFDEACKAGIVIEEPGGQYRFNHALVRQSLLAELASVRRMRLHQRIAAALEAGPGADELLAELAYHYFECAWAGNAAKAVDYCRRAADQAMTRLAYEGAADLYDKSLHALEEIDDELPERDPLQGELLIARCEALLAAGDVASAVGAVAQLRREAGDSGRLAAWGVCFDGQLSVLTDPERLDEIEASVSAAASVLAELEDAAGEAKAHTVRAGCLGRLGRIGDCEAALDQALTAARRAREHRRVNAVLANAPLAALWGPNPVPRAGGRCLDVVRLLRITTGSPVVEATSTRCQGVLDAFRGRAAAGRQLIESARRSLAELGMRHALLEVEQFAGIIELVADEPAAAEKHLRKAYTGFRRMGLDADTAETAALLARACLVLGKDAEAAGLCTESEHLAGHALRASITWRTVRAQLSARAGDFDAARRVAEEAVALAERTDALVDHGDACLALALVLGMAGDAAGSRAAAERAAELFELKGAAALVEKARGLVSERPATAPLLAPEPKSNEAVNECVRLIARVDDAWHREAWDELERLVAPTILVDNRRRVVGLSRGEWSSSRWVTEARQVRETGFVDYRREVMATRGESLALTKLQITTDDASSGAPQIDILMVHGLDERVRLSLHVTFDLEDMDAALAELEIRYRRSEATMARGSLQNAASRTDCRCNDLFAERRWEDAADLWANDMTIEDRRRGLRREINYDRAAGIAELRSLADIGVKTMTSEVLAVRGGRLALCCTRYSGRDERPDAYRTDILRIAEVDVAGKCTASVAFDADDLDGAIAELETRYLSGEAAPYAEVWSVFVRSTAAINNHELPDWMPDAATIDHRSVTAFAPGEQAEFVHATWEQTPDLRMLIDSVYRLNELGGVISYLAYGTSEDGFLAEWRGITISFVSDGRIEHSEQFDDNDLDAALARFDELCRTAAKLENTASRVDAAFQASFTVRDWSAMAESLSADFVAEDRRRVVNSGIRQGRDAKVADMRATADLGTRTATSTVTAIRGERLAMVRIRLSGRDQRPEAGHTEMLGVVETDADNRMIARILFDADDVDEAFDELESRYVLGEAVSHGRTWSVIANAWASFNRGDPVDVVNVDRRRVTRYASGDLTAAIYGDVAPNLTAYVEKVHCIDDLGALVTGVSHGTSSEGFDAEWRQLQLQVVAGGQLVRNELFDEADLAVALARFDELERPATPLHNAACRVYAKLSAYFTVGDWSALSNVLAPDMIDDDRRSVVNAGVRRGRGAVLATGRAVAETGTEVHTSTVIATRGEHLALCRTTLAERGQTEAFAIEFLSVVEIDADRKLIAHVGLDAEELEAAFTELDARYLRSLPVADASAYEVIANGLAQIGRGRIPPVAADFVDVDHRGVTGFEPGGLVDYLRAGFADLAHSHMYIESVSRLSENGAVFTHVAKGASREGLAVEWRVTDVVILDGDRFSRCELYDEAHLDDALARFGELTLSTTQLANAASRVYDRYLAEFMAGDWDALSETLAEDVSNDDRRRVVNGGLQRGRDAVLANMRAISEVGVTNFESSVLATRGERLALGRYRVSGGTGPEAFGEYVLIVVEIDDDSRFAAGVAFDPDELDVAVAELDARYLAGEAGRYAESWSTIVEGYAAFNRQELAPTTPDATSLDHRRAAAFAPGEYESYVQAAWEDSPGTWIRVESVHRLSDRGAVVTHVAGGMSSGGFEAEWRDIAVVTLEGALRSAVELFNADDLDAALARFELLSQHIPRVQNLASRVTERFRAAYVTRDWDAMTAVLAEDLINDDRRRVVNGGVRRGRESMLEDLRSAVGSGIREFVTVDLATRGERLVLGRAESLYDGGGPGAFRVENLVIAELDADGRIATEIMFDVDDLESAFDELEMRYLTGECVQYGNTWSVISKSYAGMARGDIPPTSPSLRNVDHRKVAGMAPDDGLAYLQASWDLAPEFALHIEAIHRISDVGAVFTRSSSTTSRDGFEAEWRAVDVVIVDGPFITRAEIFDESDLEAAVARFDELCGELRGATPRLENSASRAVDRFASRFVARDWDAVADMVSPDNRSDDRRRVVGAGIAVGRDASLADLKGVAEQFVSMGMESFPIATRGDRLALCRGHFSGRCEDSDAMQWEYLQIIEVDGDERISSSVTFGPDETSAAVDELDVRYLAGDAAPYERTWSCVVAAYVSLNERKLAATTSDWVNVDHRTVTPIEAGDLTTYLRVSWDLMPAITVQIEAVHRLTSLGVVITHASQGIARDGFNAEWREVNLITVVGDKLSRCELYDEADLDKALARFDELTRPAPRPENAASRLRDQIVAASNGRDLERVVALHHPDARFDDRRQGLKNSGAIDRGFLRSVMFDAPSTWRLSSEIVATRGSGLALTRGVFRDGDAAGDPVTVDFLMITETVGELVAYVGVFDPDDKDGAFVDLDARYVSGEGASHARIWSLVARNYDAFNRQELSKTTPDWVNIDHRLGVGSEDGDMNAYVSAMWEVAPDIRTRIVAVHRLTSLGAVFTHTEAGTAAHGFAAEWLEVTLLTFDGDAINRCELFDEGDLDTAVARFDELDRPIRPLENAATRAADLFTCFADSNWDALAENFVQDDRRRVVGAGVRRGRDAEIRDLQAFIDVGLTNVAYTVLGLRGDRLMLARSVVWGVDSQTDGVQTEMLTITEVDAAGRIAAIVMFDEDDLDAAFADLDARYVAGEGASYASTWSAIAKANATFNMREMPPTTSDWVNVDHRRGGMSFAPGDMSKYMRASWDVAPAITNRIVAVHELAAVGAVFTQHVRATSGEDFTGEWRDVVLLTVDGEMLSHCEVFDEDELDNALARFDELRRSQVRLQNAATRIWELFWSYFDRRDWRAATALIADEACSDDRRRVVGAGFRRGRESAIADLRVLPDVGFMTVTSEVVAIRGNGLALVRCHMKGSDGSGVRVDALQVVEVGADERFIALVVFDPDDIDAAVSELDTRYLAAEAAPHALAWSAIATATAMLSRQQIPPTTVNAVSIDHRRAATFEPGDFFPFVRAASGVVPNMRRWMEEVHRLTDRGAVVTGMASGTSESGFNAEWRAVVVATVDGDLISRYELFDEDDLDTALARFDELCQPERQLENTASRMHRQYNDAFARRDWPTMDDLVADDIVTDDRRHVVSGGVLRGRDAQTLTMRAAADVGVRHFDPTVIATRGDRLALIRDTVSGDNGPEAFGLEMSIIVECDADGRFVAGVLFDKDDVDAAFAELDARYLAGEATAHAPTWSLVVDVYAAVNRRELPSTARGWATIDRRRGLGSAVGDLNEYLGSIWSVVSDSYTRVTAVHRLSDHGVVVTSKSTGSANGFDAEWTMVHLFTTDEGVLSRCEMFDEDDLDSALARFDELGAAARLVSLAVRINSLMVEVINRRDVPAYLGFCSAGARYDDRRKGFRSGGPIDEVFTEALLRGAPESWRVDPEILAIRGDRLVLVRYVYRDVVDPGCPVVIDVLGVVRIDDDELMTDLVLFDPEALDDALAELDARYLAGDAAEHANVWSVVAGAYAAVNRHERPDWSRDFESVDHRKGIAVPHGDLAEYVEATWADSPGVRVHVEAVHRLSDVGALVTHVTTGTAEHGFEAEWRIVTLTIVDGEQIVRSEMFDESDLDVARARFDELSRPMPTLTNSAWRMYLQYWEHFEARDWAASATILSEDFRSDDRRRVVNSGVRRGRAAEMMNMRALADLGVSNTTATLVATRGDRLALSRIGAEALQMFVYNLVEITTDGLISAMVGFELDALDAALAELDARYLAGEAAEHAGAWSVIANATTTFNRREPTPVTSDCVAIDHRLQSTIAAGEVNGLADYLDASWDLTPDLYAYIETVHALTDRAAVVTTVTRGTTPGGFDAEWRQLTLLTVRGELGDRCEIFDEADIDTALARFDELTRETESDDENRP